MHDAQVEADRRRSEADEHATTTIADADERASRLLADMEAQAAEVREQGVAAARSAIQVERDKAMAELAHVRRVRDDLRTEAVDLKAALDRYRSQAREASDTLAAASSGPLMSLDLPDFIDDDVVLAGIVDDDMAEGDDIIDDDLDLDLEADDDAEFEIDSGSNSGGDTDHAWAAVDEDDDDDDGEREIDASEDVTAGSHLRSVEYDVDEDPVFADDLVAVDEELAEVISIDSEGTFDATDDDDEGGDESGSGTFLAEVRAAAEEDVALPPENEDSDRFLAELRGITDDADEGLDSDAADRFFED